MRCFAIALMLLLISGTCAVAQVSTAPATLSSDYDDAYAAFKAKNFQGALTIVNRFLIAHAGDARALTLRGDVKAELGDNHGALADFNAAVAASPDYQYVYVTRCETRLQLDDSAGALDDCNRAIALDASDALAFEDRADVFFARTSYVAAGRDYSKAISLGRSSAYVFAARCDVERITGNRSAARSDCETALEKDPKSRRGLWASGRLAIANHDYGSAISHLTDYIDQKPQGSDTAYYFRAFTYNRLQNPQAAFKDIGEYLRRAPKDPDGFRERAIARFQSGDRAGALGDLQLAELGYRKSKDAPAAKKTAAMASAIRAGRVPIFP